MKRGIISLYPKDLAAQSKTIFCYAIDPSPDYAALAMAFGGDGAFVEDAAEIEQTLRRAFESERFSGPYILDVGPEQDA